MANLIIYFKCIVYNYMNNKVEISLRGRSWLKVNV